MVSASTPRTFAGRAATADSEKNRVRHFAHRGSSGREQRSGAMAGADAAGKSDLCSVSRIAAVVTTGPDDERGRTSRKQGLGMKGACLGYACPRRKVAEAAVWWHPVRGRGWPGVCCERGPHCGIYTWAPDWS